MTNIEITNQSTAKARFHTEAFETDQDRVAASQLPAARRQWMIKNLIVKYPVFNEGYAVISENHYPVAGGTHSTGTVGATQFAKALATLNSAPGNHRIKFRAPARNRVHNCVCQRFQTGCQQRRYLFPHNVTRCVMPEQASRLHTCPGIIRPDALMLRVGGCRYGLERFASRNDLNKR